LDRGEPGDGTWTIIVKDTRVNAHIGIFTDWRISLWGESIDPSKAKLHPMPDGHEDDDHDRIEAPAKTTSVAAHTETALPAHPTDHIDRPINQKPGDKEETKPTSATTTAASTTAASSSASTTSAAATSTPSFYLPSIFPTFGVSPKTQIWIYITIAVILIFCGGLGIFFCILRRRRARTSRADYEFEMLDDHDAAGAGQPLSGGGRPKRRAGELYDAFAGESDEEIFSGDEETEGAYRDEEPAREKLAGKGKTDAAKDGEYEEK
jgi:kexin